MQKAVFDRVAKRLQRSRAAIPAALTYDGTASVTSLNQFDYLRDAIADGLTDRLDDVKRPFPMAVDLGAGNGSILRKLGDRGAVENLVQVEMSEHMLCRDISTPISPALQDVHKVVGDEEHIPLAADAFDLVMSNLSLHWVNDLPGCLSQVKRILKEDSCFLAAILGGETLQELRHCFNMAETDRCGGVSPRVSPLAGGADCANLLQSGGFRLITVDVDTISLDFPDPFFLMSHLRGMGESNASKRRQPHAGKELLTSVAALYQHMYANSNGTIPATFQIIYMIGWTPGPKQPKPIARGSQQFSFNDINDPEFEKLFEWKTLTLDDCDDDGAGEGSAANVSGDAQDFAGDIDGAHNSGTSPNDDSPQDGSPNK